MIVGWLEILFYLIGWCPLSNKTTRDVTKRFNPISGDLAESQLIGLKQDFDRFAAFAESQLIGLKHSWTSRVVLFDRGSHPIK